MRNSPRQKHAITQSRWFLSIELGFDWTARMSALIELISDSILLRLDLNARISELDTCGTGLIAVTLGVR